MDMYIDINNTGKHRNQVIDTRNRYKMKHKIKLSSKGKIVVQH